jgi:myo-inositol-1(or 4)-monophosphatase
MHAMLNVAFKAARKAGQIIVRGYDRVDTLSVSQKGRSDFFTEIDQQAEKIIIETLREKYPYHQIIGEEGGTLLGDGVNVWIIDPLDGTHNFIHGLPHFCISIAYMYKNKLEHGLIYDPLRDELFTASQGSGALLNQKRLRVGQRTKLSEVFLSTGFPVRAPEQYEYEMALLNQLIPKVADIRSTGSAALDLAYVAASRFDAYYEFHLAAWDIAAGALIVQEAGGIVSDDQGGDNYLERGKVIAANMRLHNELLKEAQSIKI